MANNINDNNLFLGNNTLLPPEERSLNQAPLPAAGRRFGTTGIANPALINVPQPVAFSSLPGRVTIVPVKDWKNFMLKCKDFS